MPRAEYAQDDAPIDGIVETWWESLRGAGARAEYARNSQAVIADEPNFMGHTNHHVHTLYVTETVELIDRTAK